jgi:hypothetical protein
MIAHGTGDDLRRSRHGDLQDYGERMQRSVFVVAVDDGSDVKGWFVIMAGARHLSQDRDRAGRRPG